jgi:hypothetical protein
MGTPLARAEMLSVMMQGQGGEDGLPRNVFFEGLKMKTLQK